MKLSAILLTTSLAITEASKDRQLISGSDLLTRWDMEEPSNAYDGDTNKFTFSYVGTAAANLLTTGATKTILYDYRCKDDGTDAFTAAIPEYVVGNPETVAGAVDYLGADITVVDGLTQAEVDAGGTQFPKVELELSTKLLANNPKVYSTIDEALFQKNEADPTLQYNIARTAAATATSPAVAGDEGNGLMLLCLRFGIGNPARAEVGTAGTPDVIDEISGLVTSTGTAASADYVKGLDYYEVNFIETLIQIKYDLTAGFTVDAFSVAPKERLIITEAKSAYELIAYLCDPSLLVASTVDTFRFIASTNTQTYDLDGVDVPSPFNQGALVAICVRPDDIAETDGLYMSEITSYSWTRDTTSQTAVPIADSNGLSALTCVSGSDFCYIESILFAEFYKTAGSVTGSGQAVLTFDQARRRNLKSSITETDVEKMRRLQDNPAVEFDVSVGVTTGADGPGALKTAGGASLGYAAMATTAAIVSAALLA